MLAPSAPCAASNLLAAGKVPDAADYMPAVTASNVEDAITGTYLPFESSADDLLTGNMVYADRRGFTEAGSSEHSAWSRSLSVGSLSAERGEDGSAISLRVHDSFGLSSRVAIASIPNATDAAQSNTTQPNAAPSGKREFWNSPQIVSLISRFQRVTGSSTATADDLPQRGMRMSFVPVRPGRANAVEAGVMRLQTGMGSGLSLTGEMIPLVRDGINRNIALNWGMGGRNLAGGVRYAGGAVEGTPFQMMTVSQSLPLLPHARSSIAWTSFAAGGQRYSEAIVTSAFAVGPGSELGIGFAMQQSGSAPFLAYTRPLGKTGRLGVSVGAPNSIATRSPIALQVACSL